MLKNKIFVCPSCQERSDIEEIICDATVTKTYSGVLFQPSDFGSLLETEEHSEGGEIERYQCSNCGHVLQGVKTLEDLTNWIAKNGVDEK